MGFFSSLFSPPKPERRKPSVFSCPHSAPYVILDTETTGLSIYKDKAVQISAIRYGANGHPTSFFNTYLTVDRPVSPGALEVNHITPDKLRGAPTPEKAKPSFLRLIGEYLLVGYNTVFDLHILENTFGIDLTGREYVDAQAFAGCFPFLPDRKLETVASAVGFVPQGGFHDSLSDCEAVAAVLAEVDPDLDDVVKTLSQSSSSHSRQRKRAQYKVTPRFISADDLAAFSDHPFFGKTVVFTGEICFTRQEAAQFVTNVGGLVRNSVSSKTDYLVVGDQDPSVVGEGGMSGKERQARRLNDEGKAHIQIIDEDEFISLLDSDGRSFR